MLALDYLLNLQLLFWFGWIFSSLGKAFTSGWRSGIPRYSRIVQEAMKGLYPATVNYLNKLPNMQRLE